jgi:hypothetical protein
MRQQMSFIAFWQAFGVTPEITKKLCRISPAAIDRYLTKDNAALKLMAKSLTRPLAPLKAISPIRTFSTHEKQNTPGFRQINTIHHCGQAASGQYLHTLTTTDVLSGGLTRYALLNNVPPSF